MVTRVRAAHTRVSADRLLRGSWRGDLALVACSPKATVFMRLTIVTLVMFAILSSSCGGKSTPTTPTPPPTVSPAPTPAPPPPPTFTATVRQDSWQIGICLSSLSSCLIQVVAKNLGPDCASAVRGTTSVFRDSNRVAQSSWTLGGITLRVGESYTSPPTSTPNMVAGVTYTASSEIFTTPVDCSTATPIPTPSPAPAPTPPPIPPPSGSLIESQIDGTFEGWTGETLFLLTNGQVWQQSRYDYYYHYAFRPRVMIVRSGSRYIMSVERVSRTVEVTRLR